MLPWFVRDYVTATRQLTLAERGAYTDLLFFQWELGALPAEPERLARLIGCSSEEFAAVWPAIKTKFTEVDARLVNGRLEQHRLKAEELSAKRVEIGRRGGRSSAQARGATPIAQPIAEPNGSDLVVAKSNSPSPSPSPSSGVSFGNSRRLTPTVPAFHQEVIEAYHELCPDLPRVKAWTKKRQQALEARIQERCKAGKSANLIDYWRTVFTDVATSDFLSGRGKSDFRANLGWLLRPENFLKVIEGNFTNRRANGTP
jgi:uncharacterized protein YdaU (DUF1376 family)